MCECCGTRYVGKRIKQLQVHHKDPEHYEDLDAKKFLLLDSSCHDLVERISTKLKGSKSDNIPRVEDWVRLLYPFFSYDVQEIVKVKYGDYLSSKMPSIWEELCGEGPK